MFAMLYKHSGDKRYLEWMDACYWDTSEALYDEDEGCSTEMLHLKRE